MAITNASYLFRLKVLETPALGVTQVTDKEHEHLLNLFDTLNGSTTVPATRIFSASQSVTVENEKQTITVDATGGTFTATLSGQTTAANAFDISTATLKTNLDAISTINSVTVTGGPGDSGGNTPYTIEFGGTQAGTDMATMTTNAGSLTGGASTAVVATPQIGGANGSRTIDMTSLTDLAGSALDMTGLKVQLVLIAANSANTAALAFTDGATDGYNIWGDASGSVTVQIGGIQYFYAADNLDEVSSSDKTIDVTSTDVDATYQIMIVAG